MKTQLKVTPLVLALSLTACGPSGPGEIAVEMYQATCDSESLAPMLEYVAPESMSLVQMGVGMHQAAMEDEESGDVREKFLQQCEDGVKLLSEEIEGDVATVTTSWDGEDKPTQWKKIDGEWKLFITKD